MIKKIITWIWLTVLSLPAFMVFNDNGDTWYINLCGILYCYLLYNNWDRITTKWMREYWDQLYKEEDDENDEENQ